MASLNFYIDGVLVPPPDNWQGTDIEISFENNSPDANVRTQVFEWKGPNAAKLFKWFNDGITGGVGITEGPPFRIDACENPATTVFNGCIDMTSEDTTFTCDIVRAAVIETLRVYSLAERAKAISFAHLASAAYSGPGKITSADYIPVPYVISTLPDYAQIAILAVSLFEIIHLLRETFTNLSNLFKKFINDLANTPFTTALVIGDGLMIVLYLIYMLAMFALMLGVITMIINNFIQPTKYKYGMRVQTLFHRACAALNLSFSSTILTQAPYNNLVLIPKKQGYINDSTFLEAFFSQNISRKFYDDTKNPNAYGYFEGNFEELISQMQDVFNAKCVIRNNTLYFQRWDYWNLGSGFIMPDQSSQAPFQDPYGTNMSELAANYLVIYTLDPLDCNTYDEYDGTSTQMILQQNVTKNQHNVLLKRLTEKRLAFSLVKRKTALKGSEKAVNIFFNLIYPLYLLTTTMINIVAYITGKKTVPVLPPNPMNARIGYMALCSDFTSIPKLLVIDGSNKVHPSNQVYTAAHTLQLGYHSASWAIDTINGDHNQYLTFKEKRIPLCCSDFKKLKDNNIIKDIKNRNGRIDSLKWNPHTETAIVNFRVKQKWTNNLQQTLVIDGI